MYLLWIKRTYKLEIINISGPISEEGRIGKNSPPLPPLQIWFTPNFNLHITKWIIPILATLTPLLNSQSFLHKYSGLLPCSGSLTTSVSKRLACSWHVCGATASGWSAVLCQYLKILLVSLNINISNSNKKLRHYPVP